MNSVLRGKVHKCWTVSESWSHVGYSSTFILILFNLFQKTRIINMTDKKLIHKTGNFVVCIVMVASFERYQYKALTPKQYQEPSCHCPGTDENPDSPVSPKADVFYFSVLWHTVLSLALNVHKCYTCTIKQSCGLSASHFHHKLGWFPRNYNFSGVRDVVVQHVLISLNELSLFT